MSARRAGFTLTEVAISVAMLVTAIALAMSGYLYVWSESSRAFVQDKLDVQVQLSIEEIKRDLRLTALERIFYYPEGPGPYTAISLPLARDDNGDGAIDLDGDGKIIWDKTVVYHVWSGSPTQLRKTTFDPRPSLDTAQLQAQLNSVAVIGNGSATFGSSNTSTRIVFENLFNWQIQPQSSTYDGYASSAARDIENVLGSTVVSGGVNTITFKVTGKNPSSTGYKAGVDSVFMTPSLSVREAEDQLPASSVVGSAVPASVYMTAGSWSGNYQLEFPATQAEWSFTLNVSNDRWEETNFRTTGELHEDTTVNFVTSLSPMDFVVELDGTYALNWMASTQTGDPTGSQLTADNVRGCAVRVLVRGMDLIPGSAIEQNGGKTFAYLQAGPLGSLAVTDAFIAEAMTTNGVAVPDAVPGTMMRLRNISGGNGLTLPANTANYMGYPVNFSVDKAKSYLFTYLVSTTVGSGNANCWRETVTAGYEGAYIIPATNTPSAATASADNWSGLAGLYVTNVIPGLRGLWLTPRTNGVYTSAVFDTGMSAPPFSSIAWDAVVPSSSYLGIKVRSANAADMSDASSWTNVTAMTSAGAINPGNKRYVQFQALMRPTSAYADQSPRLRDVTIVWAGETRVVDVGGTFTKGPDYGIVEVSVNGQPLKKGVVVNLEIFDIVRGHATSNRITSAAAAEVTPRNSGR